MARIGKLKDESHKTAINACSEALPVLFKEAIARAKTREDAVGNLMSFGSGRLARWVPYLPLEKIEWLKDVDGESWLRDLMLGDYHISAAWQERGSGWASSVTEEGWRGFAKHLELARGHLVASWEAEPSLPWAATSMITVTMAGHGLPSLDERVWFDRAVTACFDHKSAYTDLLWAYRPRWGGSIELMLEFGKARTDTNRFDTFVPSFIFNTVYDASTDVTDRRSIHSDPEFARRIATVQKAMLERATTPDEEHYLKSFLLVNAYLVGDFQTANEMCNAIPGTIYPSAINRALQFGISPSEIYAIPALAADTEALKIYHEAEAAAKGFDTATARTLFTKALKSPTVPKSPALGKFLRTRLFTTQFEERLAKGEWLSFDKNETRLLWFNYYGTSLSQDAGRILVRPTDANFHQFMLAARMGLDFEIRAKLDNPESTQPPQFGVVFGFRYGMDGYMSAMCGRTSLNPPQTGAVVVRYLSSNSAENPPSPATLTNQSKVHVRVHRGLLTMWVDDKEVLKTDVRDRFPIRDPWSESDSFENLIGFGSANHPKGQQVLTEIEVRRILPNEP